MLIGRFDMKRFERFVAACAALTFAGFAIAGCVAESKKRNNLALDTAPSELAHASVATVGQAQAR